LSSSPSSEDFPKEIQEKIAILYSVFQFMEHNQHNDYIGYRKIPLSISRQWFPTLLKIYGILMFANGAASVLPRTEIAKIDDACSKNMGCFFRPRKREPDGSAELSAATVKAGEVLWSLIQEQVVTRSI
jgi:hypothetical protein